MACKINSPHPPLLHKPAADTPTRPPSLVMKRRHTVPAVACRHTDGDPQAAAAAPTVPRRRAGPCSVQFRTLPGCKLGISRYPDFDYDALGGEGVADGKAGDGGEVFVSFDVGRLYVPPLTSATTRFLGLPLPPFLRIEIVPELFTGVINRETGQVDLDFQARFCFSVGSIYRAPPLLVTTRLTSEESEGSIRRGKGRRLDGGGLCMLVGVATVEPIYDVLMDSFLSLPTECIARLNAGISISDSDEEAAGVPVE